MKKIKLMVTSFVAAVSIVCFAQPAQQSVTPFKLINIQQYGHSDGYAETGWGPFKTKVFTGTNIYKAQMEVKNNDKNVLINVSFAITEPNSNITQETKENPFKLIIGEEIFSGKQSVEDRYVKNTSLKELEKIQSIGLSKEDFDTILKTHFKSIYYI